MAQRAAQRTLSKASINGISVGGDMAVADSPVRQLETGERPDAAGREVVEVCPVSGNETPVERTAARAAAGGHGGDAGFRDGGAHRVCVHRRSHHAGGGADTRRQEEYEHWESLGVYLNAGAGSGSGTAPVGTIPGKLDDRPPQVPLHPRDVPGSPHRSADRGGVPRHRCGRWRISSRRRATAAAISPTRSPPLVVLPYPESWYIAREADPGGGDTLLQGHARTIAKAMGFDYLSLRSRRGAMERAASAPTAARRRSADAGCG